VKYLLLAIAMIALAACASSAPGTSTASLAVAMARRPVVLLGEVTTTPASTRCAPMHCAG